MTIYNLSPWPAAPERYPDAPRTRPWNRSPYPARSEPEAIVDGKVVPLTSVDGWEKRVSPGALAEVLAGRGINTRDMSQKQMEQVARETASHDRNRGR